MMIKLGKLTVALVLISMMACSKDDVIVEDQNNYLIFGTFYGFCGGEGCIETFKLTDSALFEDTKDVYRATEGFNFVPLSQEKFNNTKNIMDSLPQALLQVEDQTFGCPDCFDQGGAMIQIARNGKIQTWIIDLWKPDVPEYLHALLDVVKNKIKLINQ